MSAAMRAEPVLDSRLTIARNSFHVFPMRFSSLRFRHFLVLLLLGAGLAGCSTLSQPAVRTFDVRAYGATGDGKALDTDAINQAIEAAAAAGGGTVWFPAGTYASYSIHLKSNVALYLDQGATILAADPPPAIPTGTTASSGARIWKTCRSSARAGSSAKA
jgi:polygalacturonase